MTADLIRQTEPFVLLDDNLSGDGSVLFISPVEIITCNDASNIPEAFKKMEAAGDAGKHLAGYLSYELGYGLEEKLRPLMPEAEDRNVPLIWLGVFDQAVRLSPSDTNAFLAAQRSSDYTLENLTPSMEEGPYCEKIQQVLDYIAAGDTYQVNFTFKHQFDFVGDPIGLFQELRLRQNVAKGAYIETGDQTLLSLSPEVFLSARNGQLTTRPMKGTAARGKSPSEDDAHKVWLTEDEKSRAENLMIVDLLRNDMSKVCKPGSVKVTELFTVETYQSLHQMTSNIFADLSKDIKPVDLVRQLFPCGSITGAPKIRTMEIIHELEEGARGAYTGSIGHISPKGDADFSVAIRTLVIDKQGHGEMGIGSGIVYDSDPKSEYQECLLKGKFLTGNAAATHKPEFDLIETLRWEEGTGYVLLEEHMERLQYSAGFFGYPFDAPFVRNQLQAKNFAGIQRVRLLLHKNGTVSITSVSIEKSDIACNISFVLSEKRTDSSNIFLYHKTTNRAFYEDELGVKNAETGCDEVLFLNERGELTEGARTNLFVEKDGVLYTPPINCGVLNGTLRRQLLAEKYMNLTEKVLTLDDLKAADKVYFGNSVRHLMPAKRLVLQYASIA